jgi:hypothetical protein
MGIRQRDIVMAYDKEDEWPLEEANYALALRCGVLPTVTGGECRMSSPLLTTQQWRSTRIGSTSCLSTPKVAPLAQVLFGSCPACVSRLLSPFSCTRGLRGLPRTTSWISTRWGASMAL